jgi:DNA-binding LytR/AlgR family response regulator
MFQTAIRHQKSSGGQKSFGKKRGWQFIQTHKSYIAAINKVESIEGNTLHIQKHQVPVSKYLREVVLGQIVR